MKLAVFLLAATACSAETWTAVQSPHFELYTTANPETARDAAAFFEQVHDLFAGWSAKQPVGTPKARIIVFQSEKDYRFYQPNPLVTAFFISGAAGDFIVTKNLTRDTYPVAVHEYVHLIVKRSGLRMPTAMNEGLAEFYSTLKITKNGIEIGTPPVTRLLTLRQSKLIPLDELLAVNIRSPIYRDHSQLDVFYAESWALTHMLLLSPQYRDKTPSYARAMQAPPDPLTALEKITGKTAYQILSDLQHYVRRSEFVTALLDAKAGPGRASLEPSPAAPKEWGMALADLLETMGRHAEARQRYEALAASGADSRN
jgi:hypothetical protein